jgi:ABC-type amino acid transport substrate-binding protein
VDNSAESDQDLITLVRNERVDAALTPYNFEQIYSNELCYTEPYMTTHQALAINRDALAELRTTEGKIAVRNLTGFIGVVKGSIHSRLAERLFGRMKAAEFDGLADAVDSVIAADIAAAFGNEVELKQILSRRPVDGSQAQILVLKSRQDNMRLAIAPQNRAFLELFNSAVEAVKVTAPVDELLAEHNR